MYIVKYDRQPILSREWINQLQILSKENLEEIQTLIEQSNSRLKNLLKKYPNLTSEEFSPIRKMKVHLNLKPSVQPMFLRSRQIK